MLLNDFKVVLSVGLIKHLKVAAKEVLLPWLAVSI